MLIQNKTVVRIKNATANNLKGISLEIPHHQFIVVTGVSGSGKSSLAFDIIAKEGQRRYFETLPAFAKQFAGKISPVDADSIEGLSPVITVGQKTTGMNIRSTVGTLSDLYSWLRLLYARTGLVPIEKSETNTILSRSLFSFNSKQGKCLRCNGLGKEEEIDLNKLVTYPNKSIRNGALAPTLPTGYIMYSQVTIDVLNEVCKAEGFNVDIVWNNLTAEQKQIILYGSEKIKVPFGKHSLEARLKWTGIKAKPREEGYYKGMIPIMTDILRRDRNANILKYVSAVTCHNCKGKRLNKVALSVLVHSKTIVDLLEMPLIDLSNWLKNQKWNPIAKPILEKIEEKINLITQVGLGYLKLNQSAKKLLGSELQRIRVVNQIGTDLTNVLYVFDEPSIGLNSEENRIMISLLKNLVKKGNTVIVVEHDVETIKQADWIIDIGPKAGKNGGELLFNGRLNSFLKESKLKEISPTLEVLTNPNFFPNNKPYNKSKNQKAIELIGCNKGNLNGVDAQFFIGKLNIVTGKSGSGKTVLVKEILKPLILNNTKEKEYIIAVDSHKNSTEINQLVFADQAAIGRTPRSNPATYLGLSDFIRDVFSKLPQAKENNLTKSHFSFNTKGGRCETCQGAGKIQIGMHFLGKVDLLCSACNGKRFNKKSLAICYKNKNIAAIYNLTVNEALIFFAENKKIQRGLLLLQKIGLGYLTLGQSSTTLSGGEAQRIKLANELQKKSTGRTLFILDEPSIGLHPYDIKNLLNLFDEIKADGNTIVCIEQDEFILNHAEHIIKLDNENNLASSQEVIEQAITQNKEQINNAIHLKGVSTHLLKNIEVKFPKEKLTVVTGLSGSGKSALVYDTLYAEANSRFLESLSTFNRSFIHAQNPAKIEFAAGITPSIAIKRKKGGNSIRSTVGTVTGINDHLRLLFSRIAQLEGYDYTAQHFSFNHKLGACTQCKGHGFEKKSDPELFIVDPEKSILNGALTTNKAATYYTNLQGQFIAMIDHIAKEKKWNLNLPWNELSKEIQDVVLYGTGEREWNINWEFNTKTRSGTQELTAKWLGFSNYINAEFELKQHNKNIQNLLLLLQDVPCGLCNGNRLKNELLKIQFKKKNIATIFALSIEQCLSFFKSVKIVNQPKINAVFNLVSEPVIRLLTTLVELGLGYLTINRIANSLSGGELQRINIAGQLSAQLFGLTYIMDEPTIGLDQKQITVLLKIIRQLIKKGNTVIIIEHNKQLIESADYIVELGPFSGKKGGEIIYQGTLKNLKKLAQSVTHQLLFKKTISPIIKSNFKAKIFGINGAVKNNLKKIDITFKTNSITAITGVSGSGKSTLIKEVLYESVQKKRNIGCAKIYGFEAFDTVFLVDQNPISITSLTTPASFTLVLDLLKLEFSKLPQAKTMGLKRGDFSYQSKVGKCAVCNGHGVVKTSMDFMSDLWLPCETCIGLRYSKILIGNQAPKIKGTNDIYYSIGEVLQLTINEAIGLFKNEKLNKALEKLAKIGIGHLQLGQNGNSLSGGEAQRLKLALTLMNEQGNNLYLFDEPSTGLHQLDLIKLITVFEELISNGHTVIFIEHNENLISVAHQQIILGPKSGELGGYIV